MFRKSLILAVFGLFPLGAGCSDDPSPAPFGPGAEGPASGPATGTQASSTNGGAADGCATDASVDHDPGYRDPTKVDGGCASPNKVCGSACVDVGSDIDNCGACGNTCTGDGAKCTAGTCGCIGPLFDYCAGTGCMDVSSDTNNCGSCGNVCDPNNSDSCVSGVCVQSN